MRTWLRLSIVLALLGAGSGTSAQRGVEEYGGAGGDYAVSSQGPRMHLSGGSSRLVPDTHTVRRGDTLWDITGYYFGNPWDWPRVWSYNPEITNPHWIYPDDSVRLRGTGGAEVAVLPSGAGASTSGLRVTAAAPTDSVWLRQQGFLDRDALATSGVVSGSPEEQMLLSPFDDVYLQFGEDARPEEGAQYTVFRRVDPESHEPAAEGELVRILGTIRLDSYDPDERLGRGVVVEALEPIERGHRVAIMDRALTMVPPRRNERDVEARVVASLRPTELVASQQVVFLDVGAEEGVQVGNRFFILRSGDAWRESNVYRSDRGEAIEDVPEPEEYPEEIIAEGRVINVRSHTATLFVSEARTDVRIGERAEMRRGF
jgi:hypothetical protein